MNSKPHHLLNKISPDIGKKAGDIRAYMVSIMRTTTFKVAFGFAALFSTFALLLMGYIYVVTVGVLSYNADKIARQELNELTQIWAQDGVGVLNTVVIERAASSMEDLFVLITPQGYVLSGNIDAVPMDLSKIDRPKKGERLEDVPIKSTSFTYFREDNLNHKHAARGVFIAGPDGYGLFVAHDLGPGYTLAEKVVNAVWTGSLAVLAFSIIGGYFASRGAARRVDELSKTTHNVMAGNLSVRAPVKSKLGLGDEFDVLTQNMNAMLDRTEKLVQSSRTIGDAVAHDLRSPLTRLRANLENSMMDAKTEDDLRDSIENAISELDKVVATFNGVLRLSRLEAGQGGHLNKTNLSDMLDEVSEFFEPSVTDKGLEFSSSIEKGLYAEIDESMFIQAVTNLLDNAVKYTESGKIAFSAKKVHKEIEIMVADSGMGIPPEQRADALKRFVRLDSARSTQGTGIGLSLAEAIVVAHKGRMVLVDGLPNSNGSFGLGVEITIPRLMNSKNESIKSEKV